MHIQANYSLLNLNTFHIDVKTRYLVEIVKQSDILTLRTDVKISSLPWRVMGGGSNILFTEDFHGVTIRCTYDKIKLMKEDEDNVWISVGAGMNWHELVTYTVENGWWGLENLALIPGTVGAAPVQNIGAYGAEAQDSITRVQALNLFDGQRTEFRNSDCDFSYRSSIFKREHQNTLLIHRVTFQLRKSHAGHPNISYDPLKEKLAEIPKQELTSKMVYDAVVAIREARLPDLEKYGNAGSFYKNPVITQDYFEKLSADFPDIPHHKMLDGNIKIPAGWLIEQCHWKGRTRGKCGVSGKHALVLVNLGGAVGSDIAELSQLVQDAVNHKFGIHLEPEVIIL